ncbi:AraC family transcriptional regulator [Maribacter algarum]|uniref:AraC family transcriptional regulator n=1 Tax=Maribacter algarum (ex Zhang et al. 2020) TaxID=2578118 RepID=A0A5S3PTJ8_9FLAO|nr:helix-turn-helix domain-containing protein [Maribacter algarum]TMM58319.1 AraC family transcriptional regulator [Maribacter algarum]
MKLLADFILITGFAITSVILFMLAISKKRKTPQNILMLFLSITLIIIITVATSLHELRNVFIFFNLLEDGARFILGPLLFIYIKSIFKKDKNLIKNHLLHFLPFIIYFGVITLPIGISRILGKTLFDYLELLHGTAYVAIIKDLYWLLYIFLSGRLFLMFKTKMKSNYSSFKKANFDWINKFLISCLLVVLFDLVVVLYRIFFIKEISWDVGLISLCFLILLTIYLGYHGLKQSTIYLPKFLLDNEEASKKDKHQNIKFSLSREELEELKSNLDDILIYEKPYLQQELTLSGLAELIGTTDKKLSSLLNHHLNVSFYDFINQYRVEEVKEKLKLEEYEKYSLLGLAYTCGFNSKSSFYRAFKKETGISPTAYKKENSIE